MKHSELFKTKNRIIARINSGQITESLSMLESLAITIGASWQIREEIENIRRSYQLLVRYALDGVNDPSRSAVYNDIAGNIKSVINRLSREFHKKETPTLYYNTLRYEDGRDSIPALIDSHIAMVEKKSLAEMSGNDCPTADDGTPFKEMIEASERRIFDKIWVTLPLSADDVEAIKRIMSSITVPEYLKQLLMSAVLMGGLEFYDERRALLLADTYASAQNDLSIKALCALMLIVARYPDSARSLRMSQRLATLQEIGGWDRDVKMVFFQFLRARDTERISRKLNDEIIPAMIKARPDIYRKISDMTGSEDAQMPEMNPEWEEMIEKSGIGDRLKELSELQEEGGDIMMTTFSGLKSFPFFNSISNWFLPFHADHSEVVKAMQGMTGSLGELLNDLPVLCNSDKYSFALAMSRIPDAQRDMLIKQFEAGQINMAEMRNSELTPELKTRENKANKYIQDIYRFFKLFRRKGEFRDPFASAISPVHLTAFGPELQSADTLTLVGEFYFKRGYYKEAYELFTKVAELEAPHTELYQKMGYCLQQNGDIEGALKWYERAELINASSLWTMRRLANCHKLLGHTRKALEYYKNILAVKPDDMSATLNLGHCYLEFGDFSNALKAYYKVEFYDEKSRKAVRPIAWCSFMSGDLDRSRKYYDRIPEGELTVTDHLNMGHLALASGKPHDAIEEYVASIRMDKLDTEAFMKSMAEDRKLLTENANIDPLLIKIVEDTVVSRVKELGSSLK